MTHSVESASTQATPGFQCFRAKLRLILAGAAENSRERLKTILREDIDFDFEFLDCDSAVEVSKMVSKSQVNIILFEHSPPDWDARPFLKAHCRMGALSACPVVILGDATDGNLVIEMFQNGASDFLSKASVFETAHALNTSIHRTLQRKAENERSVEVAEELRESRNRLNFILESARIGTWEWDIFKGEITLNAEGFRIFGIRPRPKSVPLEEFLEYIAPEEREKLLRQHWDVKARYSSMDLELQLQGMRNRSRWVLIRTRPVLDDIGRPVRRVGVCLDRVHSP